MKHNYDLDLTESAWKARHGDVVVYGSWFGKELRPCMVLIKANSKKDGRTRPCVILVDDAYKWARTHGDPAYVARMTYHFAVALGVDTHQITLMRLTGIIQDHLGDLLNIPPKPGGFEVVADAFLTDPYGKVKHTEISSHV